MPSFESGLFGLQPVPITGVLNSCRPLSKCTPRRVIVGVFRSSRSKSRSLSRIRRFSVEFSMFDIIILQIEVRAALTGQTDCPGLWGPERVPRRENFQF